MVFILKECIKSEDNSFDYVKTFTDYQQAVDYASICVSEATEEDSVTLYAMDNMHTYEVPILI